MKEIKVMTFVKKNYLTIVGLILLANLTTLSADESDGVLTTNPVMIADYNFNSNLQSSVLGAPDLEYLATTPDFQTETVFGFEEGVLNFAAGDGFKLDVSSLFTNNSYSIVFFYKLSVTNVWGKLVDFKNLTSDFGLYNNDDGITFYNVARLESAIDIISPDQYVQVLISRSAEGLTEVYIDQQKQFEFDDSVLNDSLPLTDFLYFFLDDNGETENSAGTVARITIFDRAMDSEDIIAFAQPFRIYRDGFE